MFEVSWRHLTSHPEGFISSNCLIWSSRCLTSSGVIKFQSHADYCPSQSLHKLLRLPPPNSDLLGSHAAWCELVFICIEDNWRWCLNPPPLVMDGSSYVFPGSDHVHYYPQTSAPFPSHTGELLSHVLRGWVLLGTSGGVILSLLCILPSIPCCTVLHIPHCSACVLVFCPKDGQSFTSRFWCT